MYSCDQSRDILRVPGTVPLAEASAIDYDTSSTPPLPPLNDVHRLGQTRASASRTTVVSREAPVDITSFPIELLGELFSYLAWTGPYEADLVVATHVCRHWRIAALGNPLLWAHVSATSVSKARAFFARSKPGILDVHISSPDSVEAMLNLLRSHSARVRSLHVETSDLPTTAQYLLHLSQMHVPALESLRLDGPELSPSDASTNRILHALQSRCGQEHWTSCPPLLRHLRIRSLGIPWEASLYQNLSDLDLRGPGMPPPSITRLLTILRQCPDLETFALQMPTLTGPSVSATDEWIVHLPRLRTFHLDGPSSAQIVEILEHLSLPPTTRYTLSTVDSPIPSSSYPVLPADRSRLPGLSSFRAIDVQQVGPGNIVLRCSHSTPDDPVLTLAVGVIDIAAGLANLSRAVDVTAAELLSVSLQAGTEITSADWCATLRDFASLRILRLVGATNNTLRSALGTLWQPLALRATSRSPSPGSPSGCPVRSLCERLSELVVTEVETPCRVSTDLIWLCDERKRLGCDIRSIQADAGFLPDSCVNKLRTRGVELKLYDRTQAAHG